jgi:hypothetical protein
MQRGYIETRINSVRQPSPTHPPENKKPLKVNTIKAFLKYKVAGNNVSLEGVRLMTGETILARTHF